MQQRTILVADDQTHIRDALSLLLEPRGFIVLEAMRPEEVIFYVKKQKQKKNVVDSFRFLISPSRLEIGCSMATQTKLCSSPRWPVSRRRDWR